jgi:hypothetical protein
MTSKNLTLVVAAAAALAMMGCGSSNSKPSQTLPVVASVGATLTAGAATLTIPAGALTQNTTVTLREAEPHHANRAERVEIEPHDALVSGKSVHLSVKLGSSQTTDSTPSVKMHHGSADVAADDSPEDVEVDDRNHHSFKTTMTSKLDDFEVEVEHGAACSPACGTGQECDDGACKDHSEEAKTCAAVCDTGFECDDSGTDVGTCQPHSKVEAEHGGVPGAPATCPSGCDAPAVCHDGVCSVHG